MKPFQIIIDWAAWDAYPGQAKVETTLHIEGQEPSMLARHTDPILAAAYVRRWFEGRGIAWTCNIDQVQRTNGNQLTFRPQASISGVVY